MNATYFYKDGTEVVASSVSEANRKYEEIKNMEKQYKVEMCITVNDNDLEKGLTVDELILDSLEEAPFQVDTIAVNCN